MSPSFVKRHVAESSMVLFLSKGRCKYCKLRICDGSVVRVKSLIVAR